MYYTWQNPKTCNEGGEIIQEYVYYYYKKDSPMNPGVPLQEYYCCITHYEKLAPTEGLKYPVNKIQ